MATEASVQKTQPCRTCSDPVVLLLLAEQGTWRPFDSTELRPFTQAAIGARIVVGSQAWLPDDLIEHFMTRFECDVSKARELAEGNPAHRIHTHPKENTRG